MRAPRGVMNPVYPLLLLLLGVSILPFTAVAAGDVQNGGSVTETGHGEQVVESNATAAITGVTVNQSAAHTDDTAFVWRADRDGSDAAERRIEVVLSPAVTDDHEVCLDSNACKRARDGAGPQTVSFANVRLPANRTTVDITLRRASDAARVDNATLTVWRIGRDGDLDRDGVRNERETAVGASLVLTDTDGDALTDDRELALGADPTSVDTDGDGLDDAREADLGADPATVDTDGDGLADAREVDLGTDPTVVDTDGDGLDDDRERPFGGDATTADTDGDGLTDGREVVLGANVTAGDTDGDGLTDGDEAERGTDPTAADTDGDGLADAREVEQDTDPTAVDTDEDGLGDGREVGLGADPTAADTDGDGLADAREVEAGADPAAEDTDGDYLADGTEQRLGFDPTNTYTPALYGSGLVGFLLGIGVAVSATEDGPAAWLRSAVPAYSPRDAADDSPAEPDAPAATAVRVPIDDHDGPDDGSSARDVFERHQDALVTDAERTLRMLEAEGGQMKQSAIVDATSWSKAKVSRLLSRMDDDGDIVKVAIGRENLICLPDAAPTPAQPTDAGAVSSTRLVGATTRG